MLRKSKGEGHTLILNFSDAEVRRINLFMAVKGGKVDNVLKGILLDNLTLSTDEANELSTLIGTSFQPADNPAGDTIPEKTDVKN